MPENELVSEEKKSDKAYNLGKENETTEFKKSTGELREGIISIASILNKHGKGTLYFGVKNDGTITGQVVSEDTLRSISQAVGNHISPKIYPEINKKTYGDKTVISVTFEGSQQPYLAYNIPRIRVADEDLVMEMPVYEAQLRKRYDIRSPWEREISKYSVSDVDRDVFDAYIKRAQKAGRIDFADNSIKSVLSRLDLIDGDRLYNAGAAIFVENGMNEVQMAKFASDERLTFTDIRRYTGSILTLIERSVSYVIDAMDWRVEFDGRLERKEIPEIPVNAVREAVTNAFAHRSFESGQSVEISVYRSFIDIYSPGKFPKGLTPQSFITEAISPIRRNPLITRTLYYSKDMESFATGLKRIQDACDKAGCEVEYKSQAYGFTVRFHRHCGDIWCTSNTENVNQEQATESKNTIRPEVGTRKPEVGTRKPEVGTRKPNDIQDADEYRTQIVMMINQNNRISRKEMAERLTTSERTIQRILNSIPSIYYVGRGKNGHWEISS